MALVYATVAQLRAELDLAADDEAGLSTAKATRLIESAQVRIDSRLRAWPMVLIGPAAGRRIPTDDPDVEAWQLEALALATVKLAAFEHHNPKAFTTGEYSSVSGPDFSMSGKTTPKLLEDAWEALAGSAFLAGSTMTRVTP